MTRSSLSIFLLTVGLLWAAIVFWTFLGLGGAAELTVAYLSKTLLLYSWLLISPLLLIVGALWSLGSHSKGGSILSMIGCAILTVMVGYQFLSVLHDLRDPLIMRPPWGLYAFGIILTILADAGAVQLHRTTDATNQMSL